MEKEIIKMLCRVKEDDSLKDNISFSASIIDDVGLDSLQMINFILSIEDEFGIEIDFDQFDYSHMDSISSLAEFIENQKASCN